MRISVEDIHKIVQRKLPWILKTQQRAKEKYRSVIKHQFLDGEEFLYLGKLYKLRLIEDPISLLDFNGQEFLLSQLYLARAKVLFQEWYVKKATEIIPTKVKFYAQMAALSYSRISITGATRRWGSCTSKKTLNFSWRLMMTPQEVIDYVVVHEICHLAELNHSSKFWDRVRALVPDYKQKQLWFRKNQYLLSL